MGSPIVTFELMSHAEHGIGRGRVGELERLKPMSELALMRKLKHTWIPGGC